MAGSGSNRNPEKVPFSASPSPSEEEPVVQRHVLIVEDHESDAYLIQRALLATKLPLALHFVRDGQQAVTFFDEAAKDPSKPCPEVVILDINLPRKPGGDVLRHMRSSPRCARAHVIAVSTSDSPQDVARMTELGADDYFRKPSEFDEFMKLGDLVRLVLAPEGAGS